MQYPVYSLHMQSSHYSYVIVKAPPHKYMKIQHKGVCQEANTARGEAEYYIYLDTPQVLYF